MNSKYNNIRDHMKAVHPKAEYFNCTKCGYKSQLKYLLDRHFYYVHCETNVFKCHMCDFSGSNVAALTKHVKEEHDRMNPFRCSKCSFRCPEEHILAAHTAKSHVKQEAKAAPAGQLPDLSKWLNSKAEPKRSSKAAAATDRRVKGPRARGHARRKRRALKERGGDDDLPGDLEEKLAFVKAESRALPAGQPPPNRLFEPPDPSSCVKTEIKEDADDDYREEDPDYVPPEENNIDWRDLVHPSAEFTALSRKPSSKAGETPSRSIEDTLAKEIAAAIRGVLGQQRIAPSFRDKDEYTRTRSRLLEVVKRRCIDIVEGACLLCDFTSCNGGGGGDSHLDLDRDNRPEL